MNRIGIRIVGHFTCVARKLGRRLALVLLASVGVLLALPAAAQNGGQPYPLPHLASPQDLQQPFPPIDQEDPAIAERRLDQLNVARQKSVVDKTNKLLKLAEELNAEVRRSRLGELTPGELHKIAEIQKLAHGVKEEMTMVVGGANPFLDATPPPPPTLPFSN